LKDEKIEKLENTSVNVSKISEQEYEKSDWKKNTVSSVVSKNLVSLFLDDEQMKNEEKKEMLENYHLENTFLNQPSNIEDGLEFINPLAKSKECHKKVTAVKDVSVDDIDLEKYKLVLESDEFAKKMRRTKKIRSASSMSRSHNKTLEKLNEKSFINTKFSNSRRKSFSLLESKFKKQDK
jgi:hypothetical protein